MGRWLSFIKGGEIHPISDKKVISQSDFSTLVEVTALLEQALADAEAYRIETENECARLKEIAKEEGYEEGLVQLNDQILKLDQEKKRILHEVNKLILPLAVKAAKKIVAAELELNPDAIVRIVLQALTPILQNHSITIYVNRIDKEILETKKPILRERLEQVKTLLIKERDDISPGGCIIETESGIINATIEKQWRAIEKAFSLYTQNT